MRHHPSGHLSPEACWIPYCAGESIPSIAARLGTKPRAVRRRLKLAAKLVLAGRLTHTGASQAPKRPRDDQDGVEA